jgi:tRNA dimethylallyltransferase
LREGALQEVAALMRRGLDPTLPVMRAHGAPQLMAHLRGELTLDEAAGLAVRDTRRYAKRQFTRARHQMPDFALVAPEAAEAAGARALAVSWGEGLALSSRVDGENPPFADAPHKDAIRSACGSVK